MASPILNPISPPGSNSATRVTITRPSSRQFSLRSLFYIITACALLFATLHRFGLVGSIGLILLLLFVASSVTVWLITALFLLRFAFTTWFLLGLTALLFWISATFTNITVSIVLTVLVVALWPIAALLILSIRRTAKRRALPRQAFAVTVFLLLVGSAVATQWPLRLSFAMSRPSLDRLAEQIRDRGRIREPQRAGLFVVRSSQVTADGVVSLWTEPHPSGNTGFVKCAPERAQRFNLWSALQLSDDWQLISED